MNERLITRALTANAAFSVVSGIVLIAASPWLAEVTGVHALVLALIGAGVLGWGWTVRRVARNLNPAEIRLVIAGDIAWVVAAAVIIGFTDVLTTAGAWLLAIVTAAVAAFAVTQMVGLQRLPAESP